MVKGITLVRQVASADALEKLASLLGALGFEAGKGWEDGGGRGAASPLSKTFILVHF